MGGGKDPVLCDSFFDDYNLLSWREPIKTQDFYREVKGTTGDANKMNILAPGKKLVNIAKRQFKLASGSSLNRSN